MADSLKALDPKWPIREADIAQYGRHVLKVPEAEVAGEGAPSSPGRCYHSQMREMADSELYTLATSPRALALRRSGQKIIYEYARFSGTDLRVVIYAER